MLRDRARIVLDATLGTLPVKALVGDPTAAEPLAVCVHPEEDRSAAVKVVSHVVSLHWDLPLFVEGVGLWRPRVSYVPPGPFTGAEAPLPHHITYSAVWRSAHLVLGA